MAYGWWVEVVSSTNAASHDASMNIRLELRHRLYAIALKVGSQGSVWVVRERLLFIIIYSSSLSYPRQLIVFYPLDAIRKVLLNSQHTNPISSPKPRQLPRPSLGHKVRASWQRLLLHSCCCQVLVVSVDISIAWHLACLCKAGLVVVSMGSRLQVWPAM